MISAWWLLLLVPVMVLGFISGVFYFLNKINRWY
jgi:hypothetical protein